MSIKNFLLLIFCAFYCFFALSCKVCNSITNMHPLEAAAQKIKNKGLKKPKIIIFSSKCGNGHSSACSVLKDILPECEIKLIYPIYDLFHKNSLYNESIQETLVRRGWIRTVNFMTRYPGEMALNFVQGKFKRRFIKLISEEKPDLLISVIPTINYSAARAAAQYKVPFLIITLDADLELWLLNMDKCHSHDFTITVPIKTPRIEKQIASKHIPSKCITEVGCPLRKDFFTPKDKAAIRKEWNIPDNRHVIMLMRGGTGSDKMADYLKRLIKLDRQKLDKQVHVLVCIGRNSKLIRKLNRIKSSDATSFSIVEFTPKIPDLMAISDLLITQPSPNVCNEAMHMNLPILADMCDSCLFWEKATLDWIKIRDCGTTFKHMKRLNSLVVEFLSKDRTFKKHTAKPIPKFNTEIRKLVNNLFAR